MDLSSEYRLRRGEPYPHERGGYSFQAYTFLAYGGKQISWFCYWSPIRYDGLTHFTEAMIELDGTKTAVYDYVKEINREILAFDDIYDNFEWQGSMTKRNFAGERIGKNGAEPFRPHERFHNGGKHGYGSKGSSNKEKRH